MRSFEEQDFNEYCAALVASAIYNVNRLDKRVLEPRELMAMSNARKKLEDAARPVDRVEQGTPAVILAPVPMTGMRWARKGERPPSRYGPDNPDPLISKIDARAARTGERHGRRR